MDAVDEQLPSTGEALVIVDGFEEEVHVAMVPVGRSGRPLSPESVHSLAPF
jgi:hypothetical protein